MDDIPSYDSLHIDIEGSENNITVKLDSRKDFRECGYYGILISDNGDIITYEQPNTKY